MLTNKNIQVGGGWLDQLKIKLTSALAFVELGLGLSFAKTPCRKHLLVRLQPYVLSKYHKVWRLLSIWSELRQILVVFRKSEEKYPLNYKRDEDKLIRFGFYRANLHRLRGIPE